MTALNILTVQRHRFPLVQNVTVVIPTLILNYSGALSREHGGPYVVLFATCNSKELHVGSSDSYRLLKCIFNCFIVT